MNSFSSEVRGELRELEQSPGSIIFEISAVVALNFCSSAAAMATLTKAAQGTANKRAFVCLLTSEGHWNILARTLAPMSGTIRRQKTDIDNVVQWWNEKIVDQSTKCSSSAISAFDYRPI